MGIMNIILNGQSKNIDNASTVETLVKQFSPNNPRVITEINGTIIHQDIWNDTPLAEGDHVELIAFVGGG